jgi:regulator of sigma E protease
MVTPRKEKDGFYRIGIRPGATLAPVSIGEAAKGALVTPAVLSWEILKSIGEMISGKQPVNLQGPVGITKEIAAAAKQGSYAFLRLMMLLSIYLGLFNLLPLPALDGGRVLFLGINALPIKQVKAKTEAAVHMVGLLLLLGVLVLVTFTDIFPG